MKNTIILFTVTLFSCALQAQTTAFTVLAAKGSALSQRADNPDNYINLKTGTEIFSGDKIIISDSKTYLGIVDGKGNTMELKKAGVYNSDELLKALEMSKGTLAQKYIDYLVKDMTKESEAAAHNMSVTGAVDRSTDRSQINIFVPNGLEAYQGNAAIKWLGLENAEAYEIVFLNMFDEVILKEKSVTYGISHIFMETIDEINILNASILAMHSSIDTLNPKPELILVDGNKFKTYKDIRHECIIKGDSKFLSIAAASILAKTARDAFMKKIDKEFPMYGWAQNKGYPTKSHREAIQTYGTTKYHRKSFKLLPEQLQLKL